MIDTNVLVSSQLKSGSIPWQIIELIFTDTIVPILNQEIFDEYEEVLNRNKFGLSEQANSAVLEEIKNRSIFLEREQTLEEFIDEDDIVFYEIVMSARNTMDAYLITGNLKHYPIRNYVVTPRQMLEIIGNE